MDLRSTTTTNGRLTSTFGAVPDVPVTSFKVDLPIGPHSALATRANLCAKPLALDAKFARHNGASTSAKVPIEMTDCGLKVIVAQGQGPHRDADDPGAERRQAQRQRRRAARGASAPRRPRAS